MPINQRQLIDQAPRTRGDSETNHRAQHLWTRVALRLAVLASFVVASAGVSASAATAAVDSGIAPAESISLPSSDSLYFYVGSTAGGQPMESVGWLTGQDLAVTAAYSGQQAISIGRSTFNSASYVSAAGNHAIAGAGISGYAVVQTFSAQATKIGPGTAGGEDKKATGISLTLPFTTTQANEIVLILVGGQGTGTLALSEVEATTLQNATYSEAGGGILASAAIYSAQLPVGKHKAKWHSTTFLTNAGNSLGAVAYVLAPLPPPTITSVSPNNGPEGGGTNVTITGTNLAGATAVKFGNTNAASFKVNSSTSIEAISPSGTGTVDVTAITPSGTSAASTADKFEYVPPPTITSVNPNSGPEAGGTNVTITGTNLAGLTSVKFGGTSATSFKVNSSTSIEAVSPPGSGTVNVTVTNTYGTSSTGSADQFSYQAPPPPPQSIQIGWSSSHPTWIWMTLTGFAPGSYQYWCDFGSGGDAAFTLYETVSPETWDNGKTCYDTIPGDTVWVTVGSVRSNTIVVP